MKPDLERFVRSEFRFFSPSPTRWGDCDMFGHINNVQFVRYYETGRLDYFRRVLDLEAGPNPKEALIVADLQISFLQHWTRLAEGLSFQKTLKSLLQILLDL